ncbi:tetratricopeptide repeat protein 39C isoform X1, partial [Clarias magur]
KTGSNTGWSALHLSSYFGQKHIVEELLKSGLEVNLQNDVGDTALHMAALCGRKEVVLLLLRYGASATLLNGCAQTPRDITDDDEVITMLEAAERREARKMEGRLLDAARIGDCGALSQLLNKNRQPTNVNCKDSHGDTALHIAASRGHKECVDVLVKSGSSFNATNRNGLSVLDVAKDDQIRSYLEKCQENTTCITARQFEGFLWKKSDFLSWDSHWVVLENGTVSWYCNQSDAACGDRRQGFKPLMKAQCVAKGWEKFFFTLKCCDGSVHHFKVPSRCSEPDIIRKKWLDAIAEHAVYSAFCGSQDKTPQLKGEEEANEEAMDLDDCVSHSLQAAESYQRMLESQVAMFVSMVMNEDNN